MDPERLPAEVAATAAMELLQEETEVTVGQALRMGVMVETVETALTVGRKIPTAAMAAQEVRVLLVAATVEAPGAELQVGHPTVAGMEAMEGTAVHAPETEMLGTEGMGVMAEPETVRQMVAREETRVTAAA